MSKQNTDQVPESPNHKFSHYFYNVTTYVGVLLSIVILIIELFLFIIDFFSPNPSSYLGMFTYLLLPPFLVIGLILIPWGAYLKRKRVKSGRAELKPFTIFIDPSLPTHRNALFVFIFGTTIFLVMTAVGSYKAFHYTESVRFCGITCHDIMRPEYTLYQQSPHANVKCVECHIGPGAEWYLKYKLEGARQVLLTLQNSYHKPIATPIHNLRPAKETCEHCHWPGKFFSSFELRKTYFPTEKNIDSSWFVRMLVKVGGKDKGGAGIHAHMYKDNDIYYVADDEKRQKISWVKSIDKNGKEIIFTSPKSPYEKSRPPENAIRKMDCLDCHNRPSHDYRAPYELLNEALLYHRINAEIPEVKAQGMKVLSVKYKSTAEALAVIPQVFEEHYRAKEPLFYNTHTSDIQAAGKVLAEIYHNNFFPEMKSRWDDYPENIGHLTSPGCFRCHDGEHKSSDGQVISRDCKICHTIIEQGAPGKITKDADGLEFNHPFNGDESWKEMNCSDCHTGN